MTWKGHRVMSQMIRLMASPNRVSVATFPRALHNLPDLSVTSGGVVGHHVRQTLYSANELDAQLREVKVFQDEQIIQLAFKSGETVNYTMAWLRNLCSCSECFSNKFRTTPDETNEPKTSLAEGKLSVARIKCEAQNQLHIEWLDSLYKSHTSRYNLKYLSIHWSHMK